MAILHYHVSHEPSRVIKKHVQILYKHACVAKSSSSSMKSKINAHPHCKFGNGHSVAS